MPLIDKLVITTQVRRTLSSSTLGHTSIASGIQSHTEKGHVGPIPDFQLSLCICNCSLGFKRANSTRVYQELEELKTTTLSKARQIFFDKTLPNRGTFIPQDVGCVGSEEKGAKRHLHARSVNHKANNAASGSRTPGRGEAFKTDSLLRHDPSSILTLRSNPRKCSLMGNYSAQGREKRDDQLAGRHSTRR